MARFEIQHGATLDLPDQWDPVAIRDADGEDAERQLIREAATNAGWYRLRHADDAGAPWIYYHVEAYAETGEPQVSAPRQTPWL